MSVAREENGWDANARQIHSAAAGWVERRESETWDESEQSAFDNWLSQSPAHTVAYLRADDVWRRADRLRALSRSSRASSTLMPNRQQWPATIKGVAVLAIVGIFGAAITGYFMLPRQKSYATIVGGRETLTLDDGSRIDLNTDTMIRVSTDTNQRKVWVDRGEAYFQIKHDPMHPFVVMAGDRRVTDLGTKFLVRNSGAQFEVALVEGRARFESPDAKGQSHSALLAPGDVVTGTNDFISVTTKSPNLLTNELGWRRGVLVFDRTTLGDAVENFNRYNRQKLIVADSALARKSIDGTFRVNDVEAFLEVVQDLVGLHIERHSNVIVISR